MYFVAILVLEVGALQQRSFDQIRRETVLQEEGISLIETHDELEGGIAEGDQIIQLHLCGLQIVHGHLGLLDIEALSKAIGEELFLVLHESVEAIQGLVQEEPSLLGDEDAVVRAGDTALNTVLHDPDVQFRQFDGAGAGL